MIIESTDILAHYCQSKLIQRSESMRRSKIPGKNNFKSSLKAQRIFAGIDLMLIDHRFVIMVVGRTIIALPKG